MANIFTQCLCSKFSIYRQNIDFLFVANQCKYDDKCLNNTNDKYFAISHDKKKIEKRQQQNTYTTLAPMLSQPVLFIDSIANKWHIAQCSKESLQSKRVGKMMIHTATQCNYKMIGYSTSNWTLQFQAIRHYDKWQIIWK